MCSAKVGMEEVEPSRPPALQRRGPQLPQGGGGGTQTPALFVIFPCLFRPSPTLSALPSPMLAATVLSF
jgi:hypothetical protein